MRRRGETDEPKMLWNRRLMRTAMLLCFFFLLMQGVAFLISFQYTAGDVLGAWDGETLAFAQRTVRSALSELQHYLSDIATDPRLALLVNGYEEDAVTPYQSKSFVEEIRGQIVLRSLGYDTALSSFVYQEGRKLGLLGNEPWADLDWSALLPAQNPEDLRLFTVPVGQEGQSVALAVPLGAAFHRPGYAVMIMRPDWLGSVLEGDADISVYALDSGSYLYQSDRAQALTQPPEPDGQARTVEDLRVTAVRSEWADWAYVLAYPVEAQQRTVERMAQTAGLGLLVGALIAVALSRLFAVRMTLPLKALHSLAHQAPERRTNPPRLQLHSAKRRFGDTLIIYLVAVCLLPMLLYMGINSVSVSTVMRDITTDSALRLVRQTARTTNALMKSVQRTALSLSLDTSLQAALKTGEDQAALWEATRPLPSAWDVALYDLNGTLRFSTFSAEPTMDSEIYQTLHEERMPYPQWQLNGDTVRIWRKVMNLLNYRNGTERLGYLVLSVPAESVLLNVAATRSQEPAAGIADETGRMVLGAADWTPPDLYARLVSQSTVLDGSYCYAAAPLWKPELRLILRFSRAGILSDLRQVLLLNVLALLGGFSVTLFVSYRMSQRFAKSVEIMRENLLGWTPNGPLSAERGVEDDEIAAIAAMFNEMSGRIAALIAQTYEMRIGQMEQDSRVRQAEYYALQAQINPHFLYNTLESIKYTVREGQTRSAVDMLDLLGDLFRAAVDKATFVPLEQEIHYAKAYIRLQCIRFEERLSVRWRVDDELLGLRVPRLVLQPILENAIVHGMQGGEAALNIELDVCEAAGTLRVEIANDGQPLAAQQVDALNASLAHPDRSEGIGLMNVHRRLRYYYGEAFGAAVEQALDGRFVVRLTLPLEPFHKPKTSQSEEVQVS